MPNSLSSMTQAAVLETDKPLDFTPYVGRWNSPSLDGSFTKIHWRVTEDGSVVVVGLEGEYPSKMRPRNFINSFDDRSNLVRCDEIGQPLERKDRP